MKFDKVKLRESVVSYLFLAPFLTVFVVFLGYPALYSLYISFRTAPFSADWYNVFGSMQYVGLANYRELLADNRFWWSLFCTFIYGLVTIPSSIALGLGLAILLNNKLKGRNFFRTVFYLPNVLDLYVVGTIWVLMLSPNYGLVDVLLSKLHIHISGGLLGNPWTALPTIGLVVVLKGAGFGMILFLSAIQNIPESVYEAAEIDGATAWQKLRYITIPLVKPVILFMIITGTMNALNAFTEVYAMASTKYGYGGPFIKFGNESVGATSLSGLYLYLIFERGEYGKAAAFSYLLMIFALIISFINQRFLRTEK
ncbi:MAG: sugar ABC transporter permease [Acidobacteriota bacterium]|nr:sugar ABC transporter permease [Blastocatellia bacterium]MDW8411539.1 sugar ABC transporter permease [Acidobacteriota bacterium]